MSESNDIGAIGEQIERLVGSAQSSELLGGAPEPTGYYYLVGPDGKAIKTLSTPDWHGERLASPAELLIFVRRRLADKALKNPAIFYNESAVVLTYDSDDRRDVAVCQLTPSDQYKALVANSGQHLTQDGIVRLLRITYRGCLSDQRLLTLMREIKWAVNAGGEGNIQHGKESMGRSLVASVQGVDAIPDEMSMTIPVFDNHKFRTQVSCAIDISVQNRTFAIIPFPQELHNAMESTLDDILMVFADEGLPPMFRGKVK